jgi:glycosyltransferase involved in cell wall biosynthesis
MPYSWRKALRDFQGQIIVPSNHVEQIYRNEGIKESKISKVPYGYNPDVYSPEPAEPSGSRTMISTFATPHFRKGLDYLPALGDLASKSSVSWRIHAPYEVESEHDFWEDPRILDRLRDRGFDVTHGALSEGEVAGTYREADLVVQPSRSEGFGLVILEAMACGTPVVTSNWGGQLEFAGDGMIRAGGAERAAGRAQYFSRAPGAKVYELEASAFRETVRRLARNPSKLNDLGQTARSTVKTMTWDRSAERLVDILGKLKKEIT